jgi:DNA-binding response OmpR family regulator
MKTILVVDDERSISGLLEALLTMEGYQVVTASNGREALEHLGRRTVHLVLSDVMMPVMRGDELCSAMRAHADYRTIPIILMSAVGQSIVRTECSFALLINKPFNIETVLSAVTDIFSRIG